MPIPDHARQRLADFCLGAPVHSSEGRHIGSLKRLVVHREDWDPHAIVVQETLMFSGHAVSIIAGLPFDEVVVPLGSVATVTHDRIDLSITAADIRRLPPYLTYHYEPATARELKLEVLNALAGGLRFPPAVEEARKVETDIEIRKGENVMLGHQGHLFGHVREVVYDDGELAGIVVHPEGLFEHNVVIPVRFLSRSDDAALFVHMRPEDVERVLEARSGPPPN